MKRGKKLFTYLLVLVMLLANTVTGVAAELDEPLQEATQIVHEDGSGLLSEGGLLEASDAVADSSYDHSHDAAIVAAMENMQDTIDVTGYGLTTTNCRDIVYGLVNLNPQLFYVGSYSRYSDSAGNVTRLVMYYKYTNAQVASMQAEIDAEVAKIEAAIDTTGLSEVEIALAYHDYLVADIAYDYENYLAGTIAPNYGNIYGVFVEKKAVCQGYAEAFMYLMKRKNITCGYVSSSALNHAWNVVYLNNQWYHLDATWDDPTWDNLGKVRHTYFMLSDARLLGLSSKRSDYVVKLPYGYTYTKATDTRYEADFWKDVETYMYPYNGNWYYLEGSFDYGYSRATYQISKYNYLTKEKTCEYGPEYTKWTTSKGGTYSTYLGRMAARNGFLYLSTGNTIEQYNIETKEKKTILTLSSAEPAGTCIYGLGFSNDDLYYVKADNANYAFEDGFNGESYYKVELCTSHVYGEVQTIESTYEAAGSKFRVCKICGYYDQIENYPQLIEVWSISIDVEKNIMTVGETADNGHLFIIPGNATDKTVSWTSSNSNVASVDENGIVTANAVGTATITATANDGRGAKESYVVTVKDANSSENPDPTPTPNPTPTPDPTPDPTPSQPVTPAVTVRYTTHVQTFGWQGNENDAKTWFTNGAMAGTSGKAKRLEGIKIRVTGNDNLGIQYTTHCQSYGWLPWSANGEMNGTEGEAKRLEAIKIQLTGSDAGKYDVYYRVHAQSYGWLGWVKNGAPSGTAGYAKRLEGIQIVVVKKGASFNTRMGNINSAYALGYYAKAGTSPVVNAKNTSNADPQIAGEAQTNVTYRTHVQSYGWQAWKYNGQMSGTSGQAKRLEGINIRLSNQQYSGDIVYTTHVQSYGWQGNENNQSTWRKNGVMSGTSGEAKRLEAIRINLTGEMAKHYDIYYRVHAQSFGWLDWAKNGAPSGTAGYAKRLEGIQIILVPKGQPAPAKNYGGITSVRASYIAK